MDTPLSRRVAGSLRRLPNTLLLLAVLLAAPAHAQWSEDPAQNLVLADRATGQAQPKIVATADGGFFVSWFGGIADGFDVYLQRLDAEGIAQWEQGGQRVAERSFTSTEDYGLALSAEGHALLAFRFRDEDGVPQVAVNRVTPEGELLWPAPGLIVSDETAGAAAPRIAGLPDGGAVVAWTSHGSGQAVLQKLDASGAPQWGPEGVAVGPSGGLFLIGGLSADDEGNVIIGGQAQVSTFDRRLWAQKLGPDGAPLWGSAPVEVFDGEDGALQFGYAPPLVPDGEGGAVFAWYHVGGVSDLVARVQHVRADGSLAFAQNGVAVAPESPYPQGPPSAAYDAAAGAIHVAWPTDHDPGTGVRTFGVLAQRIDASGARRWGEAGRTIVPQGESQTSQVLALPAPEGALFAWATGTYPEPMRIDAARLDAEGDFAWTEEVVALKTPAGTNARLEGALSAHGFAAFAWSDGPSAESSESIKAQNISLEGRLGPVEDEGEMFTEDFEDGIPASWAVFGSLHANPLTAWTAVSENTLGNVARSTSSFIVPDGEVAEDYLATPLLRLASGSASLRFLAADEFDDDRGSEYEVLVSTTDRSDPATYTTVAAYTEADFRTADEGGLTLSVDLSAYAGQEVYLAFLHRSHSDSDSFFLDNVEITGAAVPPPAASVAPEAIHFELPPGGEASQALVLSNLAPEGGASLTFSATAVRPDSVLVDFEDGEVPYGLTLGIPEAEVVEEEGGNPGRWLRNSVLETFAPSLYMPSVAGSPFVGDFVERRVASISVDAQTLEAPFGVPERPFTLQLTRFHGEPDNPEVHDYVYFVGPEVAQPGEGWKRFTFPIPSGFEGRLPEGWSGGYYGDLEDLPPGVTFQDVLREVDRAQVMWGHPAYFYLLQPFDLGVDNVRIDFGEETEAASVAPAEGSVAAGSSETLTLTVSAEGLEAGTYAFEVTISTNDAEAPALRVPVTLTVQGVATEEGAAPLAFALAPNHPNPFSGRTTIEYVLPEAASVRLQVFDATGRLVATLVEGEREAGTHAVEWSARGLAGGVYFCRLEAGSHRATQKMVLLP